MKTVIIDDEPDAITSLSIILTEYCDNIEIVGTANSAIHGVQLINEHEPQLVLLDIEMPGGNGFDLLESVSDKNFHVVFTTAYEHYAIKAIRANAIDYLMKPINIDELISATNNVRERLSLDASKRNKNLLQTLKNEQITKIPVAIKNEYLMLDLEDIYLIQSAGSYSVIRSFDQEYVTSKNLKYYESLLSDYHFFRVSNSRLVNLEKITRYMRTDGGTIELRNRDQVAVAKNKRTELKRILGIGTL